MKSLLITTTLSMFLISCSSTHSKNPSTTSSTKPQLYPWYSNQHFIYMPHPYAIGFDRVRHPFPPPRTNSQKIIEPQKPQQPPVTKNLAPTEHIKHSPKNIRSSKITPQIIQ